MIKYSFAINNWNSHLHNLLGKVMETAQSCAKDYRLDYNSIIVEDFGTTLYQAAYTDETGYFVTYRLHPLDSHLENMQKAAIIFENKLKQLLHSQSSYKPVKRECVDPNDKDTRVTLYFSDSIYSIGD